ncbi:hemolysin III family protein [Mycoplasmatota bacterium]|nr:hemolysin III family protein [Mycoplasmatota bacterium]
MINFFTEHLKHHKIEKEKKKLLEINKDFTLGEELFNSISHGIGALLSIAGLVLLTVWSDHPNQVVGMSLFGASAILMYLMSTLYHAFPRGKTKKVFERFDHSSMYILIAGSYTPLCFIAFPDTIGWVLFGIQWGLAIIGVILKSIWVDKFEFIHVILFLLMGWSFVFFIGPLLLGMPILGFILLTVGVACYSIGLLFYIFTWFKFHHGLWHLFVLAGTILYFFSMYTLVS